MNLGDVNKGAVALIVLLLFGAGGYLWWSMMYKPAVAARVTAVQAASAAEARVTAAEQQLAQAQQAVEDAKKESAKLDDSVARLAKARTAIPPEKLIDDAAIVLMDLARQSGVQTGYKAGSENGDLAASASQGTGASGSTPIDLEFPAAGTYSEMMHFMQAVESTVEERDDTLYSRGRLFNVISLKIGGDEEDDAPAEFGSAEALEENDNGFVLGPNDIEFTIIVRMYMTTTENASSVGEATPDPAAAATDPAAAGAAGAAGGAVDPGAAAAGTGGTDPAAAGGATTTDPAAAGGATTGADPAAATAGAGAPTGGTT